MTKLDGKSLDTVSENVEKSKELFPEVFSKGKINFTKLQEELAEFIKESVVYDEEKKKRHARVVFKDKSFADTNVKTNAIQVLKQFDIDDVVSV